MKDEKPKLSQTPNRRSSAEAVPGDSSVRHGLKKLRVTKVPKLHAETRYDDTTGESERMILRLGDMQISPGSTRS